MQYCTQDHVFQVWRRATFPLDNIEHYRAVQHSRMRGLGIHPWGNSGPANSVPGLQAVELKLHDCRTPRMGTGDAECAAPAIADPIRAPCGALRLRRDIVPSVKFGNFKRCGYQRLVYDIFQFLIIGQ